MVGWAELFAGLGSTALQACLRLVWNFFVCDDAGRGFVCVVLSAHYSYGRAVFRPCVQAPSNMAVHSRLNQARTVAVFLPCW